MRLALALALIALPAAAATVRGPADLAALTAGADLVVYARVAKISSAWGAKGPAGGLIFTSVLLAPLEVWKGAARQIVAQVPGGAVGEIDQTVQGVARFAPGEEVVVFLRNRAPGVFEVSHWALGKFSVSTSSARPGKRAFRDRASLTCLGCGADEDDELGLTELRARVLQAAGKQ